MIETLYTSSNLPLLPVLIPLLTGIALFAFRRDVKFLRLFSMGGAFLTLGVSLFLFLQVSRTGEMSVFCAGGWSPPFGIVMTVDLFSAIMLLMSSVLSLCCLYFGMFTLHPEKEKHEYYPLWQFLMVGTNGAFVTGDLFNLFVFFEIMLMASYVLLMIGSTKAQLRETYKYLIINILGSTLFLVALGILYSMIGSMNMADIAQKVGQVENQGLITVIAMIFMVVFGLKAAMVPLHYWLPQVHTVANATVSAIFSGLLIKIGVYALIRVFTLIFIGNTPLTHGILLIVAAVTIVLGVIGAVSQMNYKRILAYHSISQIGYMVMGLGLFTASSVGGAIYYTVHHAFIKGCLFLTAGVAEKITGTRELKDMGGLLTSYPALSWVFFLAGMSLAGVPPLSGFFGKFILVKEAVALNNYWMTACAVGAGVLTLFSMIKIFMYAYWGSAPRVYTPARGFGLPAEAEKNGTGLNAEAANRSGYGNALLPCFILVGASLLMGLLAQPVLSTCVTAGEQLMNPAYYIDSVMRTVGGR